MAKTDDLIPMRHRPCGTLLGYHHSSRDAKFLLQKDMEFLPEVLVDPLCYTCPKCGVALKGLWEMKRCLDELPPRDNKDED